MQYTLGMAKDLIDPVGTGMYGVVDSTAAINKAIRALAAMSGWKCLRQTYRFSAVAPEFALPQGSDGLVRVCVNGQPASVRGRYFTYLQSGIGSVPPPGYVEIPVRNVVDEGFFPTWEWPPGEQRLALTCPSEIPVNAQTQQPLDVSAVVTYEDGSGVRRAKKIQATHVAGGAFDLSALDPDVRATRIVGVALSRDVSDHLSLYAVGPDGTVTHVATYHPSVKAPVFRWYKLPGARPGTIVDILAESRVDPLPLVSDTDIVPFPAIEPIEWMIRAEYESRSGEVDRAQKYREAAAQWLTQQETTDETVQEPIVINSVFDGSPGEVSADSWNI